MVPFIIKGDRQISMLSVRSCSKAFGFIDPNLIESLIQTPSVIRLCIGAFLEKYGYDLVLKALDLLQSHLRDEDIHQIVEKGHCNQENTA